MSAEENKAIVRRYFAEIDERGDASMLDEFLTPDFVTHNPLPGTTPDLQGFKDAFNIFKRATPGYHVIHDMIAQGDKVASRITAHGTHVDEFLGIPATGKQIVMDGIAIHRLEDGRIAEHWHQIDTVGLLQQLGVIPEPAAAD